MNDRDAFGTQNVNTIETKQLVTNGLQEGVQESKFSEITVRGN
jgi:hypothetical protein